MNKKKEAKKKGDTPPIHGIALDKESAQRLTRLGESTGLSAADVIAQALKFWEDKGLTQPTTTPRPTTELPQLERLLKQEHAHLLAQLDKRLQQFAQHPTPDEEEARRVMPEPTRKQLVQEALKLRDEGLSWGRIADLFNRRGQATLSGIGKWHGQTLGHWIRRETGEEP
ncbi:hypothetical protein Mmc1_2471 [Magnetococcus marinus MC-1]|uniref:Uncharacterized protein n=1 Tax=Magnetococcus marinus (strain ATCC BAA-1437 / JCM 17883 / MC-1) TaxID=156889 RepID=A0LAH8_MAGMM|nr:hypothetical protein [Magnetococcus marinus]ABK44971.1 hypothetical protein Mmc1_2471 [Magnetococcus marinus MC-1]